MGEYTKYIGDPHMISKAITTVLRHFLPLNGTFIPINKETLSKIAKTVAFGNSGIILVGATGTGKTELMKSIVFVNNNIHDLNTDLVDSDDVIKMLYGGDGFQKYYGCWRNKVIAIDDLGTEPEHYMDFGNKIKPFVEIVRRRDKLFTSPIIFATTNLSIEQLTKRYGSRVMSRLAKDNKFIEYKGKDLRLCQRN